ncbi:hypothetical protein BDA99DRAFT_269914 [Phascolomyces articulosus]|uniref:ZMIZ1/ZMIZ2 GBD-like domain-containing protein n=1 Tax=Phascolomyces articulosus TaxID=60185 RepID=A0AAD5P987_9FUNG|nr:hypothetical protein BDA99DRAFT_269914 [Phascolomyces articulosus]
MASPTSTSHSTAAASSQPSVSNVNHSNMNSNSPIASVAAADAIAGSVAQGTNNNSTSTTAIASATVVSPISISAETSPLTPTVVQNPTQAQDLANKQQQDLLLILNQLRQKQQQQQPQPQQRSPSFQRGVSVPQSPISPQHPPQPRQQSPCQQQQPSQVQQKNMDSTISHRNNLRLSQLQKEISSATMYGPACDEFLEWLQDVRAYNIANEAALVKCANAVRNNFQVGRWSSLQIFDTIFRFINHLSEPSRVKITQWRDEIRSATMGEVSGRSSASSRSQTSSPVATSLANMAIRHAPSSDPSSDPSLPQRSPHLNRSLPTTSMSPQHTPIQSVPSNIPLQQRLQIQQQQRQHFQQLHQSMMIPTSIPPAQPQQYMFQLPHHPIHQQPQPHNINIPQHTQPAQQSLSTSPSSLQPGIQVQQQQLEQMIWNTYTAAMNNQNRPLGMALTAANNGPMVGQQQLPQQLSQQPPPPPQNQLPFIRKIGYAVSPFRLKHNQKITKTPFFIDNDQFSRMWRGMQQGPMNPNRLPLSYVLTSWRDQTLENKCEWPDAIKIQLNRTIPNLTKVI